AGPHTVGIHPKTRVTPLIPTLATPSGSIMSPPPIAKLGANFGSNPVGVGPFMFDSRVIRDRGPVLKAPDYHTQNAVHLDRLIFKPISDSPSGVAALLAGDIQVLSGIDSVLLPGLRQNPSIKLIEVPQLGYKGIRINLGNKNGVTNLPYTGVGTPLAAS